MFYLSEVPAHFDFVSASQSSLPVAGACASCHHASTADARPSIAVRLQQQTMYVILKMFPLQDSLTSFIHSCF